VWPDDSPNHPIHPNCSPSCFLSKLIGNFFRGNSTSPKFPQSLSFSKTSQSKQKYAKSDHPAFRTKVSVSQTSASVSVCQLAFTLVHRVTRFAKVLPFGRFFKSPN
jgi:hypothetical protein